MVQKKSTPRRKPRNSGGSPSGVNEPPMFATRKIKNTTTWTLCCRSSFARMTGRIITIDAPVVPMMLARNAPSAKRPVFVSGAPWMFPRTRMPPATVNSASSNKMKGIYSGYGGMKGGLKRSLSADKNGESCNEQGLPKRPKPCRSDIPKNVEIEADIKRLRAAYR